MMIRNIFRPADILIPKDADMTKWSTVACDQYSANPRYWDNVAELTANVPSTMHLMFPEAYLQSKDANSEAGNINNTMERYLNDGVFETLKNSYVYVERILPNNLLRRGLIGKIDLEYYDYSEDAVTPIRATEHTVENRLPARVEIRKNAPLEMPHIMVFIDDPADTVMACAGIAANEILYDFDLMCGGGHIVGKRISGPNADLVTAVLDELTEDEVLRKKYGHCCGAIIYAIGDGNHSLAAAKKCWNEIRDTLTPTERQDHPARFALVELVNIHDEGVVFHPIHRTVFHIEPSVFASRAEKSLFGDHGTEVTLVCGGLQEKKYIPADSIGQVIQKVDDFCHSFSAEHNGEVDYIHGDAEAISFGSQPDAASILLPAMGKKQLFTSVMTTGVFCKKSFSIGEAPEKRYYLECRAIK